MDKVVSTKQKFKLLNDFNIDFVPSNGSFNGRFWAGCAGGGAIPEPAPGLIFDAIWKKMKISVQRLSTLDVKIMNLYIQIKSDETTQLLNKPYLNEVYLTGQNLT